MRLFIIAGGVLLGVGTLACSGSGTPTSPAPQSTGSGVVTINVVAVNGAQSFSPNPATLPAGQVVVWRNIDTITHHVVLNDRSVDTGDLGPGVSSRPTAIGGTGDGQYHCSIHPSMVGSINQNTSESPCQGPYCN
jgi:plastocyanin